MSRERLAISDGIIDFCLSSIDELPNFINEATSLLPKNFVWRGHRCDTWKLESRLDRLLERHTAERREEIALRHLAAFQYATRGRRGTNPALLEEWDDWWALGQHHGLATPLLDWTTSPYVAAYFAFIGLSEDESRQTPTRVLFGLSEPMVKNASGVASQLFMGTEATVRFVRPMSDENARLVSQGGLFTRAPLGIEIESWVRRLHEGEDGNPCLVKIAIKNSERWKCLRLLNSMNINHLSLFPDLYGASKHCNTALEVPNY